MLRARDDFGAEHRVRRRFLDKVAQQHGSELARTTRRARAQDAEELHRRRVHVARDALVVILLRCVTLRVVRTE